MLILFRFSQFRAHPDVVENLRDLSPIATAASFGSLLTLPELQANCFRIEALVHLRIEGHLVFRNPVPMKYAWERMASKVKLWLFEELSQL